MLSARPFLGEKCGRPSSYLIDSTDQSAGFWSRRNHLDRNFLVSSPFPRPIRFLLNLSPSNRRRIVSFFISIFLLADTSETVYFVYIYILIFFFFPRRPISTARPSALSVFRLFSLPPTAGRTETSRCKAVRSFSLVHSAAPDNNNGV